MSRVRKGPMASDNFLMVSRAFARDSRLSLKARGLGLWLFSHQDGWSLSVRSIAGSVGAGKEAVQSGLQELTRYGYLRREQSNEAGRFGDMDYIVTDVPPAHTEDGFSAHGSEGKERDRRPDSPSAGSTVGRVSGTHKETKFQEDHQEEDQKDSPSPDGEAAPDDGSLFPAPPAETARTNEQAMGEEFEERFWPTYPRKVGKLAAHAAYLRARKKASFEDIQAGLKRHAVACAGKEARFVPHASTWLNAGRWMDEPEQAVSGHLSGPRAYQDDDYWSSS